MSLAISVIHDDPWFIALNKPVGIFTQAPHGVPSLQDELVAYLELQKEGGAKPFVGVVHRLDRPTSGIVIFARNARALARLNEQFRLRTVSKEYLAVVHNVPPCEGVANDWMRKIDDVAKGEICDETVDGAKLATLSWNVLASMHGRSLVRVCLMTGRMHQIRLQFASRGWPIVGDMIYDEEFATREDQFDLFGLHSASLSFRHPKTAKQMKLAATVPDSWKLAFPEFATYLES